jgi:hypothetical protein
MRRSPKLQCKPGRPALGSSRPRLRTPASVGHPSQSSTGRDSSEVEEGGRSEEPEEEEGAVTEVRGHGVVAMDGVNVVKPSGYSVRERNLGVENPRRHENSRTEMANARLAPRGRCGPATGSVHGLHALPTRDPRGRTSRHHEMRGGRSLPGARPDIRWGTKWR